MPRSRKRRREWIQPNRDERNSDELTRTERNWREGNSHHSEEDGTFTAARTLPLSGDPSNEDRTLTAARTHPQNAASRPSCSSQDTPSSSSSRNRVKEESDIPGYYYDEATKNYYKIMPDQMSSVNSFVTRENLKKQEAERRRQVDLEVLSVEKCQFTMNDFQYVTKGRDRHLPGLLHNVQCGNFSGKNMQIFRLRNQCAAISPSTGGTNAHGPNFLPGVLLDHIEQMHPNPNFDRLLCMWSLKSYVPQYAQMLTVQPRLVYPHRDSRDKTVEELRLEPVGKPVHPMFHKIACLCWAPGSDNKHRAVIVTSCPFGKDSSIATVVNLNQSPDRASAEDVHISLSEKLIWTCAWNGWNQRLSVGARGNAQVIDVVRRNKWIFNTCGGDPVTQVFSPKEPFDLYSGTKKGLILRHDARASNRSEPIQKWNQIKSLAHIKLQKDLSYLTASDVSGQICTWDKRMNKVVLTYEGLVNSYRYRPFYFDETETILTSTGSDSYTNIWDVRSGVLLRRIPPPLPATNDGYPVAVFSSQWGGTPCSGCLIMAIRDRFEFYR